jgi:hypothetical protein
MGYLQKGNIKFVDEITQRGSRKDAKKSKTQSRGSAK